MVHIVQLWYELPKLRMVHGTNSTGTKSPVTVNANSLVSGSLINQSISLYFKHWAYRTVKHKRDTVIKTERERDREKHAAIPGASIHYGQGRRVPAPQSLRWEDINCIAPSPKVE